MKYKGQFRDKNDALHTITITTKVGTGTTNLVLSTSPFVEELEGDGNTIFKPCKYSSATVRILAKDYMWDIFQSKAQDVSVELTDEVGNIEWTGFVTPNLYDMGYESDKEELEIECMDALSTLQYFKYTAIGDKPRTNSFLDIIKHILKNKTPYTYMYFPSYLQGITLDKLKICEQNFFDKDGDDWTMQEVLEEICQYLNVTCTASGNSVYFINYSALGKVTYMKYGIQTDTVESTTIEDVSASIWTSTDSTIFNRVYATYWFLLCKLDAYADGEIKMYVKHTNSLIWQEVKFYIHYKNGVGSITIDNENKGDITYAYIDRLAIVRDSSGQTYIQWRGHENRNDYANVTLITSTVGTGIKELPSQSAGQTLSAWAYSVYVVLKPSKTSKGDESYVTYADLATHKDTCYTIDSDSYSDGGGTISLLPSFNKISVTSKINEYKELLPDVFEEKYLSNANGEWNKVLSYVLNKASTGGTSGVLGRYKFVTNPHYKTYYYNKSDGSQITNLKTCSTYYHLQDYVGATLLQASFEDYNAFNIDTIYVSKTNKTLTNYILIHQHDKEAGKLVFSTVVSDIPETYIGKNTKMVIKGSIRCMDREKWMYIPTSYGNKKDDFSRGNLYLTCKLKWGDYYYQNYTTSGSSSTVVRPGRWVKQDTTFRLYFNAPDTSHINNKDYSILDTSGDYTDADLPSGYVIPLPESATVQGSIPEFSIYTRGRVDGSYRLDAIWLKDFSIQLAISKDSNVKADEWETDTQYTNIINEDYVEEGEEIECKINTWDNKVPTYSVVMYSDNSTQYYLDTVTNTVTGNTYRMEEHIIYDYVTQYRQPSIQLDINIRDRLNPSAVVKVPLISSMKKFIVDSYSRDYYSCNNNIKLVEKWNL